MEPGGEKEVEYALPDGAQSRLTVQLKEIQEKVLPPVDDELAKAATEFDTLDELHGEIESRLRGQLEAELEAQFRAAAVDALVAATELELADGLVQARAVDLWNALVRSLERRGISAEAYLQLSNRSPEEIQADIENEARRSLAREIVLEAAANKLGVEVADAEVEELIHEQAEDSEDAEELTAQVRDAGRYEALRADLRLRKTLDRIAAEVKRIPVELARARDKLWTPEKEKPETAAKLWTPGSKEPA
jgi:trigger factor